MPPQPDARPPSPDRYAVMGNPIAHSRSPQIHTLFAEQTQQSLVYEKILVPAEGFADAVAAFLDAGGRGLNVTVPFKREAWAIAERTTARAARARAVNTLAPGPKGLLGDNTDGIGLVRDLRQNHRITLAGRRLLILGAGGAVRGVLPSLLDEAPAEVVIANRTIARAQTLATEFSDLGAIGACGFAALAGERFDLVINGTAASLEDRIPPLPSALLGPQAACYDMAYADRPTAFVRWALRQGASVALDGLGMLVEQAAESFFLWRGVHPDTKAVIRILRATDGQDGGSGTE